jgi:hypothetical protein
MGTSLNQGLTKSCGCLQKEIASISGQKNYKENSSFEALFRAYKIGSRLEFKLTKEEFKNLTSSNCNYCDEKPNQIRKKQSKIYKLAEDYLYNGIDRINSDIGYILDNCVPCCGICNKMKGVLSKEKFTNYILKIAKNYEKNKGKF